MSSIKRARNVSALSGAIWPILCGIMGVQKSDLSDLAMPVVFIAPTIMLMTIVYMRMRGGAVHESIHGNQH